MTDAPGPVHVTVTPDTDIGGVIVELSGPVAYRIALDEAALRWFVAELQGAGRALGWSTAQWLPLLPLLPRRQVTVPGPSGPIAMGL